MKDLGTAPAPLEKHNLAQYVVSQHEAGPEQGIGCRFEMTGDATDQMKLSPISIRVDESNCDRTFALVRLMFDRDHVIDSREELLHILARAAAMDILRRADRALKRVCALDEQIGQSKKRRGQFQATRFTQKKPREKGRFLRDHRPRRRRPPGFVGRSRFLECVGPSDASL